MVSLSVERRLQVQTTGAEEECLANAGGRRRGRQAVHWEVRVLNAAQRHPHRVPLVGFLVRALPWKHRDIQHTQGVCHWLATHTSERDARFNRELYWADL